MLIECFSVECCTTKTKVITRTDQIRCKQQNDPVRIWSYFIFVLAGPKQRKLSLSSPSKLRSGLVLLLIGLESCTSHRAKTFGLKTTQAKDLTLLPHLTLSAVVLLTKNVTFKSESCRFCHVLTSWFSPKKFPYQWNCFFQNLYWRQNNIILHV